MSIKSLLKRLAKALPVVLAAAPGVVDAVKQVRKALKKPKSPDLGDAPAAAAGRLSADSERAAR